jgi:hypothetical protein
MSQSIQAAKRRRAVPPPTPGKPESVSSAPPSQPPSSQTGLTLPQVIALIDTRLVTLERFMNETKSTTHFTPHAPPSNPFVQAPTPQNALETDFVTVDELSENMTEFDGRFQLLATEIANLKDIVLSLQKYTMDVNKMLLDSQSASFSLNSSEPETPQEGSTPCSQHVHFELQETAAPES